MAYFPSNTAGSSFYGESLSINMALCYDSKEMLEYKGLLERRKR